MVRWGWGGLQQFILCNDPVWDDKYIAPVTEVRSLTAESLRMKSGFALTKDDRRYTIAVWHRERFGRFLHDASLSFSHSKSKDASDDHIDAVMVVNKGIDTYLLNYTLPRTSYPTTTNLHT